MDHSVLLLFGILFVLIVLFLTDKFPVDVTALCGVLLLVLLGYMEPIEAFKGFSSPAIITLVAMFFLSTALEVSGLAYVLGGALGKFTGDSLRLQMLVVFFVGALLSSVMHNVATVALLIPSIMSLALQKQTPPSKLLMPLSFGVVLGGMTTAIGNNPNILVTELINSAGGREVGFFTFTPTGLLMLLAGALIFFFFGPLLLPARESLQNLKGNSGDALADVYKLEDRLFSFVIEQASPLIGKNLKESRLGDIFGLGIISIVRDSETVHSPGPHTVLQEHDRLIVQGRQDTFALMLRYQGVELKAVSNDDVQHLSSESRLFGIKIHADSMFVKQSLRSVDFARRYGLNALAVRRGNELITEHIAELLFEPEDMLICFSSGQDKAALLQDLGLEFIYDEFTYEGVRPFLSRLYIPFDSPLDGLTVSESCLRQLFGVSALSRTTKAGVPTVGLEDCEELHAGDRLVVIGMADRFKALEELGALTIIRDGADAFVAERRSLMAEIIPAPRSKFVGKTIREIDFRERFNLQVLAIWRQGAPIRTEFADIPVQFGDALLVYGSKLKQKLLELEGDFLSLNLDNKNHLNVKKSFFALFALCLMVVCSIFNLAPVYLGASFAAVLLVLTGVISMEDAYKKIEWRLVFLIAALIPLGAVVEDSGAAAYVGQMLVNSVGAYGLFAVLLVVCLLGSTVSQCLDTAVTLVIFAPIVVHAAEGMGFDSYPLLILLSYATSVAFLTPFSHKAHLLIMGAGGYRVQGLFQNWYFDDLSSFYSCNSRFLFVRLS